MAEAWTIWIDNDACPRKVREIIYRASERRSIPLKIVANSYSHPPTSTAEVITVSDKFDAADDYIAENVAAVDIVITADVPLADRVVEKGAVALSPHGRLFTAESIKEQLTMRNLSQELRSAGEIHGGPSPFGPNDIKRFAGAFDRLIAKK